MDRLDERMIKATNKLDIYVQKTSYCKLWIIIILEFAFFLFMLIKILKK
jgi:hypothetical protein